MTNPVNNQRAPDPSAMSLLVLDDERIDRHRISRLCSGLDIPCHVCHARTLHEFSQILEEDTFALILLDFHLPDGNGLDALEMVRLSPRNVNARTIMISGNEKDTLADTALANGCCGFLTKDSLTTGDFRKAVTEALNSIRATLPEPNTFESVEALAAYTAQTCARDLKPMVSRLMRQVRGLRAAGSTSQRDRRFAALDQSCLAIWEFLVDLERTSGADLLPDAAAISFATLPHQPDTARKPPSPFSRRPN